MKENWRLPYSFQNCRNVAVTPSNFRLKCIWKVTLALLPRILWFKNRTPLYSFPGSHTPHLSIKSPQPWTLSGSTCTSRVHIYFMYRPAECVLGYLLLGFMMLWLMKGFLGVLCFRAVGKPGLGTGGAAICPLHPPHPPQSGHHVIFRHFVNYPAIHLYVHFPRVHNHDFT